jgi:hypothetical protein
VPSGRVEQNERLAFPDSEDRDAAAIDRHVTPTHLGA